MSVPKSTPKDVFLHLLATATLYVSVISLLAILFQYIDTIFQDGLYYSSTRAFDTIRSSVSSLIVVWPVYIFVSSVLGKTMKKETELREVKIRKWLLYLTLFVTAVTIIVDLIALINKFLGGELTTSFLLKVLAILLVAGSVFGYYIWDLKRDAGRKTELPRLLAYISSGLLLAVIIGTFFVVGTPGEQRKLRFDERRVRDLQETQYQIINFWQNKERLPENLEELDDPLSSFAVPTDPETEQSYEYSKLADLQFELCATFTMNSPEVVHPKSMYDPVYENWEHGMGRVCFEREIDPERYKNNLQPIRIQEPIRY